MPTDFERGTKKTIDLSVKAEKLTSDILRAAMQEFLNGTVEKKGRMTLRQLAEKSNSKLESIEVTQNNIGDFLKAARKYDVDFALKRDKSTTPPTYHVFFSTRKMENFKKAFSEYIGAGDKSNQRTEFSREKLRESAERISRIPRRKQKEREKTKENMR